MTDAVDVLERPAAATVGLREQSGQRYEAQANVCTGWLPLPLLLLPAPVETSPSRR